MSGIPKLHTTDDTLREVAGLIFGDGASELVSKLSPTEKQKKFERKQAQVGFASNVVGITAGGVALKDAVKSKQLRQKVGSKVKTPPFKLSRSGKYLAIGAVGLQAANLGGDLVSNRVLARAKKKPVSKMEPGGSDLSMSTGKLKRLAIKEATPHAKKAAVRLKSKTEQLNKADIVWEGEFSKVDSDKRQVFGWASIVEKDGETVFDLQGDYMDIEEIEKSAYDYVIKSRKGGDMHRREGEAPVHASDMIESFLVTPEKISKMGLPENSLPLGWWVGYKVNDDEAWNLVKSGQRTGFSIHGKGVRT